MCRRVFYRDTFLKFYNKQYLFILFQVVLRNFHSLLIIMSSPGQKRGSCGHVMALFDNHKKCARCREKGVGDDPCVKKLDCQICKTFTPAQIQQLATPTYRSRKECEEQKKSEVCSDATPTLWTHQRLLSWDGLALTSRLQLNQHPPRRSSVLMAFQSLANEGTAVNLLLMTSSPWMTSEVRGFHDLKLCF